MKKLIFLILFLFVLVDVVGVLGVESNLNIDRDNSYEIIEDLNFEDGYEVFEESNPEDEISIIIEFENPPMIDYEPELDLLDDVNLFFTGVFGNSEEKVLSKKVKSYREELKEDHKDLLYDWYNPLTWDKKHEIENEYLFLMNGISTTIEKGDFEDVKNLPNVKNVWEDEILTIQLQDSVPLINADDVWAEQNSSGSNITGQGVVVAIIDSGIAYNHSDLGGCTQAEFLAGTCERIPYGYDFYNDDDNPYDDNGHGTHCAGIVGANGNLKGVAPNVTFLAYKVCSSRGLCPSSDIIAGIENATLYGADVISMSLGGSGYADNTYVTPINNAVSNGTVVVLSGGNSGPSYYSVGQPAATFSALTVGASDKSDNIASFSSRGFSLYSNYTIAGIKPDVVAPGVSINSTVPSGTCSHCTSSGYKTLSGTSMACPHISGVVALLKQAHPTWNTTELKSAVSNPSIDIDYDSNTQGSGRVDVMKSYNLSGIVIPNNIFLGLDQQEEGTTWNSTKQLELRNMRPDTILFGLNISFNTTTNISVFLSNYSMNLAGNDSAFFNLTMEVNNSGISPGEYYGDIVINSSDNHNITVPFAVYISPIMAGCPTMNTYVNEDLILNTTNCSVPVFGSYLFILNASDITLDCNDSIFTGGRISNSRGIYSNENNVTIKNCEVRDYSWGIYIHGDADLNTVINNTVSRNKVGIRVYYLDATDTVIEENEVILSGIVDDEEGITVGRSSGVVVQNNNITIYGRGHGLGISYGENNTFRNNNVTSISSLEYQRGMYIIYSEGNYVVNNTIGGRSIIDLFWSSENIIKSNKLVGNDNNYAQYFYSQSSNNNLFINNKVIELATQGYEGHDSMNNTIKDMNLSSITQGVYMRDGGYVFLINITNTLEISLDSASNVTRKWYLTINATDENSNVLQDVNVSVYENSTGSWVLDWSQLTDSNGLVLNEPSIQYFENSTKKTYYTLNISISRTGYASNETTIFNLTGNTQIVLTLQSGEPDSVNPSLIIYSPINGTIYTTTNISLNYYSSDDVNVDSCWYTNITGTNITLSNCINSSFIASDGYWNITVYVNDTSDNLNSSQIFFTVDEAFDFFPNVTLSLPADDSTDTDRNITFECNTTDDIQLKNVSLYGNWTGTWHLNQTMAISGTSNSTQFNVTNLLNGTYIWNCYVCDNSSQCNFSVSNWTVEVNTTYTSPSEAPNVTIVAPGNNSYFNETTVTLNFTVIDDVDENLTCWYDLDGDIFPVKITVEIIKLQGVDTENLDDASINLTSVGSNNFWNYIGKTSLTLPGTWRYFIKFNISEVISRNVINSELFIWKYGYTHDSTIYLDIYGSDSNWTEETINGTNYPNNYSKEDEFLTSISDEWLNWDVTNWVLNRTDGEMNNVSFMIKKRNENNLGRAQIYSKEYTSNPLLRPYLNITYKVGQEINVTNGTYTTFNLTSLSEGKHNLSIICQDSEPQNGTSTNHTFYIDLTNPVIDNPTPADNDNVTGGAYESFIVDISDNINLNTSSGSFFWKYPEGEFFSEEEMVCSASSCSYILDMSGVDEGEELDFYFEIKDMAGNTGNNGTSINPLTVTKSDATPPYFTTVPAADSITYGNYWSGVDFDATDAVGFDSYVVNDSRFTINSSGYLNMTNINPVGIYNLNITINDTSNNLNSTIYILTINQATPSLSLTGTTPITYGDTTDFAGSGCPAQLTCSLNLSNQIFGAGTVTANYSTSGNTNYTSDSDTFTITINQATPTGSLTNDRAWTFTYDAVNANIDSSETNTGDADVNYIVNRDDVGKGTSDSIGTGGTYQYKLNTTGGTNYSSVVSMDTETLTINKATGQVYTYINLLRADYNAYNDTATGKSDIWLNGTLQTGVGNVNLYLDNVLINLGTGLIGNLTDLPLGSYYFKSNYTGNTNYTSDSESWLVTITIAPGPPARPSDSFSDTTLIIMRAVVWILAFCIFASLAIGFYFFMEIGSGKLVNYLLVLFFILILYVILIGYIIEAIL